MSIRLDFCHGTIRADHHVPVGVLEFDDEFFERITTVRIDTEFMYFFPSLHFCALSFQGVVTKSFYGHSQCFIRMLNLPHSTFSTVVCRGISRDFLTRPEQYHPLAASDLVLLGLLLFVAGRSAADS